MTITLQAFSLVENAETVQVRFTLRLTGQRSIRMQDVGDRPNTKPGDRGTPNAYNR
jgi:hypothetical protein